jgi:hypothetical protein
MEERPPYGRQFGLEENTFVDSLMSLGAFIVLMAILFAVPDPGKSVAAKAAELRQAA